MFTKQEIASGLRWCRDHLGAFIATFWMIIILFGIAAMLTYAFLKLDYHFSRPLAGGVIPADVTQTVAWGTRLFTLVAGSLAIYFHVNEMHKWRLWATILGAFGAVLLMLHAYGVAAKIMEGQYARAAAVQTVAEAGVSTVTDQIADIDAAMTRAASDRDAALLVAQQTIDSVKDQVVGLSRADNDTIQKANTDKAAALAAYDAKVLELEAQKQALRTSEGQAVSTQATDTSVVETFNPLFTFLARLTTLNFNPAIDPPDGHKYVWGAVFFTLFFGFGELALIFCLTGAFAALKVVSERKRAGIVDLGTSEDVPDGHIRVEIPQSEWEAMQEAMRVHGNIKQGAKKGATTRRRGNKIEATRQYMEERVSDFMTGLAQGKSPAQVAASHGLTLASLEASYGRYFTAEEYDAFFGSRFQPEPEPEPPIAVADSPQEEGNSEYAENEAFEADPVADTGNSEAPENYPVAPYEPPANDEPDGKEAA